MINKDEFEEHEEEVHKQMECPDCRMSMEAKYFGEHDQKCKKKGKDCPYCNIAIPFDDFNSHTITCGSRTRNCLYCNKAIILMELESHEIACPTIMASERENKRDTDLLAKKQIEEKRLGELKRLDEKKKTDDDYYRRKQEEMIRRNEEEARLRDLEISRQKTIDSNFNQKPIAGGPVPPGRRLQKIGDIKSQKANGENQPIGGKVIEKRGSGLADAGRRNLESNKNLGGGRNKFSDHNTDAYNYKGKGEINMGSNKNVPKKEVVDKSRNLDFSKKGSDVLEPSRKYDTRNVKKPEPLNKPKPNVVPNVKKDSNKMLEEDFDDMGKFFLKTNKLEMLRRLQEEQDMEYARELYRYFCYRNFCL